MFDAWGISWGDAWSTSWGHDATGTPIEVWDWKLEPGGHWKHLFKPAFGVTTPVVKSTTNVAFKVLRPDVARISIAVETPAVVIRGVLKSSIAVPNTGTITLQTGEACGAAFRVVKPRCGGSSRFVTGSQYSLWNLSKPFCGCKTSSDFGFLRGFGTVLVPKTIQNPSLEMISTLW